MTFQELLKVLDEEVYVAVEDVCTEQEIECDASNSIIQMLNGEVIKIRQTDNRIIISVDFRSRSVDI